MPPSFEELRALRLVVAQRAGLNAPPPPRARGRKRKKRRIRRVPIFEWLATEFRFVAAAIEVLRGGTDEAFLPKLSWLALPQYLESFARQQREDLCHRALDLKDAWWQRFEASQQESSRESPRGRGCALRPRWTHPQPVSWEDVRTGMMSFLPIRLGPYIQPDRPYGYRVEMRATSYGGPGVERVVSADQCVLQLPGVSWPGVIEASVVRRFGGKFDQVVLVFDVPDLRRRTVPSDAASHTPANGVSLPTQEGVCVPTRPIVIPPLGEHEEGEPRRFGPGVYGSTGYVVAGMSQAEMEILIAANMEAGGTLSQQDRERAEVLVERRLGELRQLELQRQAASARQHRVLDAEWRQPADADLWDAGVNVQQIARTVWRNIVGWPRRPARVGAVDEYLRKASPRLSERRETPVDSQVARVLYGDDDEHGEA